MSSSCPTKRGGRWTFPRYRQDQPDLDRENDELRCYQQRIWQRRGMPAFECRERVEGPQRLQELSGDATEKCCRQNGKQNHMNTRGLTLRLDHIHTLVLVVNSNSNILMA